MGLLSKNRNGGGNTPTPQQTPTPVPPTTPQAYAPQNRPRPVSGGPQQNVTQPAVDANMELPLYARVSIAENVTLGDIKKELNPDKAGNMTLGQLTEYMFDKGMAQDAEKDVCAAFVGLKESATAEELRVNGNYKVKVETSKLKRWYNQKEADTVPLKDLLGASTKEADGSNGLIEVNKIKLSYNAPKIGGLYELL